MLLPGTVLVSKIDILSHSSCNASGRLQDELKTGELVAKKPTKKLLHSP